MSNLRIFTDGGSRSNPGPAAIGVVVWRDDQVVFELGKTIGIATNNEAEYIAVIEALGWLLNQGGGSREPGGERQDVDFFLDSKLVVEQLNRNWKIKEPRMQKLASNCWDLISSYKIGKIVFKHVPRSENADADTLVNQALDAAA